MLEIDFPTIELVEGKVKIIVPNPKHYLREDGVYEPSWAPVFYNPRMVFNRDVAVLALSTYSKQKSKRVIAADVLAGTGVRGIRFAVEVESVDKVIVNDIDPKASLLSNVNVKLNNVEDRVVVENYDANLLMRLYRFSGELIDYIDVDPFGTPVPYIESALNAVRRGGMVAVTATDTATLSGVHRETCKRRYWANTFKVDFEKEVGLRVLMGYIALRAASLDLSVDFKLSYYSDHYYRVYFTVEKGAKKASSMLEKLGYIDVSSSYARKVFSIGGYMGVVSERLLGPLWIGELADVEFLNGLLEVLRGKYKYLESYVRARRLIETLKVEYNFPPYYYRVDRLCRFLKMSMPPLNLIIRCIIDRGYKACRTHFDYRSFKSDAPANIIVECIKKCAHH